MEHRNGLRLFVGGLAVLLLAVFFPCCAAQTWVNDTTTGFQCFGMHALIGANEPSPVKAIALLQRTPDSNVTGVVFFTQNATGSHTAVHGIIQGLHPGLHGLHVHTYGDVSNGCNTLGSHYNPLNRTHKDRSDIDRHAGDLGNIQAGNNGIAEFYFIDCQVLSRLPYSPQLGTVSSGLLLMQIPLRGANSILGRAILVHANADDLGQGESDMSNMTGNAGPPVACGVIALRYHA